MIEISPIMIPDGSFIISWYHIKLITGGSFSLGAIFGAALFWLRGRVQATPSKK